MPITLGIIGGASVLGGGIANYLAQSSANDRAAAIQSDTMKKWLALNVPDPEQQKVVLDKFVNQGKLDPALQTAIKQDPTAFNQIVTDAGTKNAQSRALSELENVGYSGGLRLQDKEALQEAQLQDQAQERGQRGAIQSQMAQRGLGGSGFDVAAQLQAQQSGADRGAQSSLRVASDAQNRALQAIEGAGNMANQQESQDFSQQAQKASAADRINQFNTQNVQNVSNANVGLRNRAQEMNLSNAQDIANKNTGINNQQSLYNSGLIQQQFDNNAKKLAGATGQANTIAKTNETGGTLAGNALSNAGSGIGNAAFAGAAAAAKAQTPAAAAPTDYSALDEYLKNKPYSGGVSTGSYA